MKVIAREDLGLLLLLLLDTSSTSDAVDPAVLLRIDEVEELAGRLRCSGQLRDLLVHELGRVHRIHQSTKVATTTQIY